ncbi:KinB-signaling pathway activation protein [Pullulanibacillus camelliae]|uniref:KinB-signaling pathway activation protein n=1 Tax=Pullulanibacillus camelliae TaxID=1707096 RepID=A0A8J3E0K4_9BACL|nr:KinB-signaling pathway activation protein [Pullulanibacillus camelliae]GGE54682.1 KinB-signaling pathway activation protein [Pullulanibacillus camelliae]
MSIRKWVSLFLKTLLLGCVVGLVIGIIVQWHSQLHGLRDGHISGFFINLFVIFVLGGLFSVISQMGFFFYLTLHRIALGIFRSHSRWGIVQWFLIVVTFVDFIYLRYKAFGHGESVIGYLIPPVVLFIIALVIAEVKKRETNKIAYIPALFFMFVVTTLEWLPVLRQKENSMFWVMGLTLVVCNAYQMLKLHRLLKETQ